MIHRPKLMSDVFCKNMKVVRHEEDYCPQCLRESGSCYNCGGQLDMGDEIVCDKKGHKHRSCN